MRNYKCDPLMMGQRLKELRRNAKNSMSQLAFAEEIGTCLGNISKIEQGLRFPTMEILYDYMNYFDGDANLLCGCDIENQNREDSIDAKLEKLPPAVRDYLTVIFVEMIEKCPFR